jgi:hypothetical protein
MGGYNIAGQFYQGRNKKDIWRVFSGAIPRPYRAGFPIPVNFL